MYKIDQAGGCQVLAVLPTVARKCNSDEAQYGEKARVLLWRQQAWSLQFGPSPSRTKARLPGRDGGVAGCGTPDCFMQQVALVSHSTSEVTHPHTTYIRTSAMQSIASLDHSHMLAVGRNGLARHTTANDGVAACLHGA